MSETKKYQIKLRRDTEANWSATESVLGEGEIGLVKDSGTNGGMTDPLMFRVGDGTKSWTNLPEYRVFNNATNFLPEPDNQGIAQPGRVLKKTDNGSTWAENDTENFIATFTYSEGQITGCTKSLQEIKAANTAGKHCLAKVEMSPGNTLYLSLIDISSVAAGFACTVAYGSNDHIQILVQNTGVEGASDTYQMNITTLAPQATTLPAAKASLSGSIYQYLGATDTQSGVTHGYFYECVASGSGYTWNETAVQREKENFVVNVSIVLKQDLSGFEVDTNNPPDKRFAEIYSAYLSGQHCIARVSNSSLGIAIQLPMSAYGSAEIGFSNVVAVQGGTGTPDWFNGRILIQFGIGNHGTGDDYYGFRYEIISPLYSASNVNHLLMLNSGGNVADSTIAASDVTLISNIAANYSSTSTYIVGDYVMYSGTLYKCNTAIPTAEEWTAAHWTQTTVMSELMNR